MPSMWTTLSRSRDGMIARGAGVVRRTREAGAGILSTAEGRATELQLRIAVRRESLNGRAIEKVERRVLASLEGLLARMGFGLREQARRLAPGAAEPFRGLEVGPSSVALPETIPAPAPKKRRMRIAVTDVPASATPKSGKKPSAKRARPAARSTRWVSPRPEAIEELAKLPVKVLLSRIDALTPTERAALLDHEKATKKRKSVIAALAAN